MSYIKSLNVDSDFSREYYEKSIVKTEQQKFLEKFLEENLSSEPEKIADVACGGGTLSFHLSNKYVNTEFYLSDYSQDALDIAKKINADKSKFFFSQEDITKLSSYHNDQFDLVFCWQTLSWIDEPQKALDQLIRIAKPGGRIYCSSLFNIDYDVDIYSTVIDHTRPSSDSNLSYHYNTFSSYTINNWLKNKSNVKFFKLHDFSPSIPLVFAGKGIGTKTILTNDNKYLQVSGGMLLNWAILEIQL